MKRFAFFFSLVPLLLACASLEAAAQTLYWDTNGATAGTGTTATANWNGTTDWTTDSTGSSATVGYVSGDSVVFSAGTNGTGAQAVTVNGAVIAAGLAINNGILSLAGTSTPSFTLGSGGLTFNSTDGAMSIATSLPVSLSASQNWANDSTQNFTDAGAISGTGVTLTFNGTGSGTSTLSGAISGTMGIADSSATSVLYITPAGTDSYSGGLSISNGGIVVIGSQGATGGSIALSGGGALEASVNNITLTSNITLGTGGGKIAGAVVLGGAQLSTVDFFTNDVITGGTGLTVIGGDFLPESNTASNVGTINLTSTYNTTGLQDTTVLAKAPTRMLAFGSGILGNNATVNVGNNTILDLAFAYTSSNQINFASGSALAERGNGVALTLNTANVALPTAGSFTIGDDDTTTSNATITINGGWTLSGAMTIYDNVFSGLSLSNKGVNFAGTISSASPLTFAAGNFRSGGIIYLSGANTSLTGGIYIDTGAVVAFGTATAGGSAGSNIHLAGGTADLTGFSFPSNGLAANLVLDTPTGSGTQDILKGIGGVDAFSGEILNGTSDTLHVQSDNLSFAPASAGTVSNYTTLYIDTQRLFITGPYGTNALPTGTIYVANGAGLDFNTSTTFTVNNPVVFSSGALLETRIYSGTTGTNVTLTNATLPSSGTFITGSDDTNGQNSSVTITNAQTLSGDLTIDVNEFTTNLANVYLQGGIGGSGGLIEASGGNNGGTKYGLLTLSGTNTYSGGTTVQFGQLTIKGSNAGTGTAYAVQNGTLIIATGGSIPTAANVTLGSGTTSGILALGDSSGAVSQTVASLTTSGTGTTNAVVGGGSASVSTLTVNNSSADTFAGSIGGAGTNQNALALVKNGAGTLTLSGANTYTGGTTVSGGKLAVDGSVAGNVAISLGAKLGGHGSIAGTLSGAGSIDPGNSPGILSASALNPASGTSFNFEFTLAGAPTYSSAAASGNDVLHLEGATPFAAALTSANVINLYFASPNVSYEGGFFINGTAGTLAADLANATFNFYMEDDANGTVTYNGVKYDLTRGTQSTMAVTGAAFADGVTNGAVEIFTAPEPSTYALLIVGGVGLLFLRRRALRTS